MTETLSIAYSPCPNDTFVFHAWSHGLIEGAPHIEVTHADIDVTNNLVREGGLDVMKISYAALPEALDEYVLLPCGGALGRGCGPLVLTGPGGADSEPSGAELAGKTVAVPSLKSTAYLLFQRWAQEQVTGGVGGLGEIRVLPFHEIMPAVRDGLVDAGLVIHEARFTYPDFGLRRLADLGDWWESVTGAPIPLGAIVARRALGPERIAELSRVVRESVDYAFAHPEASRDYVMEQAQELDPEVAKAHIALYVNEFTRDLGPEGYAAVRRLLGDTLPEGTVLELALRPGGAAEAERA
ncbi:1,4-dihydroxy-6-naphthoate synthase [Actinocrinis sp.]|uniref:1,4-dihydroxy-6-naphthoate synthase n=1 Tax=Actinocrinis sp. TaxID=1920516 RepID=UPI002D3E4949|nr:1,4-dihydroxy-6-naphthoate synthase [Actinocrinis sp.]HZP50650.1 1,4-dihydroxy-6-naphthoate synthase [Actinocrinis sp.]